MGINIKPYSSNFVLAVVTRFNFLWSVNLGRSKGLVRSSNPELNKGDKDPRHFEIITKYMPVIKNVGNRHLRGNYRPTLSHV